MAGVSLYEVDVRCIEAPAKARAADPEAQTDGPAAKKRKKKNKVHSAMRSGMLFTHKVGVRCEFSATCYAYSKKTHQVAHNRPSIGRKRGSYLCKQSICPLFVTKPSAAPWLWLIYRSGRLYAFRSQAHFQVECKVHVFNRFVIVPVA